MSVTTNKNDPRLKRIKPNGQQESYIVLSEQERARGFIRPVLHAYIHVGRFFKDYKIKEWSEEEIETQPPDEKYVATIYHLKDKDTDRFIGGSCVTQKELDSFKETGYYGGCNAITILSKDIAETYARDPKFYGATYCSGCKKHLHVNEFIWKSTKQIVGS